MSDGSTDPTDGRPVVDTGFSTAEKAVGAWAAYEHPLISSVVAARLLESETDPVRQRQLTTLRRAALLWWGAGLVVALIFGIVVISIASGHGLTGGDCRGGPDEFDAMNITYQSTDDKHWTATYPCVDGGSTTIPVPRRSVPGGGR